MWILKLSMFKKWSVSVSIAVQTWLSYLNIKNIQKNTEVHQNRQGWAYSSFLLFK